jgi:hypothetical protein
MRAMDIDLQIAASLGFAKTKYLAIEHERRWLCDAVPRELGPTFDEAPSIFDFAELR